MNPNIGSEAAKGGHGKAAKRQARADELLAKLPALDSPGGPEAWLEAAARAAFEGCLPSAQANAIVRACEVYVKGQALQNDVRRIKELERRCAELERELAKRDAGPGKRPAWNAA